MKEGTKILATVDGKLRTVSESSIRRNLKLNDKAGIRTPTESHHTPSPEVQPTSPTTYSSSSLPPITIAIIPPVIPTASLPTVIPSDNPPLRQYTRRTRIAQSSVLPPVADEPAYPLGDDSQGKACSTDSGFEVDQDRVNIAKTSTLPSDSTPRVTSFAVDEGTQELEINSLKARIKLLEDKNRGVADQSRDDAPIKGRRLDKGEEVAERVSDDTEEMATVLTFMDAASILTSGGVQVVPTAAEVATATDYEQIPEDLSIGERIELISDLIEDFIPMGSKEEAERLKRKGLRLEQESVKKLKTSEEVLEEVKSSEEVPKEKVKEMMQLVPIEEVYVESLQVKHLIVDWKVYTEGQRSFWKIIRLGGSSVSYQFFMDMLKHLDREDLN
nr:hypothetical protein [Tanacetum cinerariifolium]